MSNRLLYTKQYPVHVFDTGSDGRLTAYSLFNCLQDIASEHATRLRFGRDDLIKENRFWVLSRIYARIEKWPEWEDILRITTWPRGTDRLFAIRDFEIHGSREEEVATATSSWLVLDRVTRRVQKPDSLLSYLNGEIPERSAAGRFAEKIEIPAGESFTHGGIKVRQSNLDINMHVNNANYIRWICDTYEPGYFEQFNPASVELNFLAESVWGDELEVKTSTNGDVTVHAVVRVSDKTTLATARIIWRSPLK